LEPVRSDSPVSSLLENERRILGRLAAGGSLSDVLTELMRVVEPEAGAGMHCCALLVDQQGDKLRLGAAPTMASSFAAAIDGTAIGREVSPCSIAAFRNEPVYVADLAEEPLWREFYEDALHRRFRACWSTPIVGVDNAVVGTFAIYGAKPGSPDRHALELIASVVQTLALAIERHTSDEALRESEERFRLIANSAPVPIWVSKLNGERAFANQAYLDFLGLPYDEALVFDWRKVLHPDDLPRILQAQVAGEASKKPFALEARYRRVDGVWCWIRSESQPRWDASGQHVGFIGVAHDITAAKQAETELRRLNETLSVQVARRTRERDRIWNVSQDLLLVLDRQGKWLNVNPAWSTALGWDEDVLLADDAEAGAAAESVRQACRELARFLISGGNPRFEGQFLHADGSHRWISWTSVLDDDLIYAVGRDVTSEKEAQRVLRATEEELRQAQKMEAVGQLTGGIAHDFNNLLTGIIAGLDIVRRRIAAGRTNDVERFIEPAMNSAHRAAALTHRLLAFSRRQSLDPKPVSVEKLIGGMDEMLRRTLGEQIDLRIACPHDLWTAEADHNQLENAILNLVINARDAMPEGGTLEVRAKNLMVEAPVALGHAQMAKGEYIEVSVSDEGVGMEPSVIEHAFDPFFTTKPIGQGTGLGLSMVYGFAKQSRGHVHIESEHGRGTTVKIFLPRTHLTDPLDRQRLQPDRVTRARDGECILVVEDEPGVRMTVTELLSELGYRVLEAADGPDALAVMEGAPQIDLLVTDVGLPGMNGRQLAEHARAERPGLKVLFMTGYAEKAAIRSDFISEGMDLITKPFAVDHLAAKIREIIEPG